MKLFISTYPFCQFDSAPMQLLESIPGLHIYNNPFPRRLTPDELESFAEGCDFLIASTETITHSALDNAPTLKLIARTGIGLDNVPLEECKKRNIQVTNCPDGPTQSVAELNIAFVLDALRYVSLSTANMRAGQWKRNTGHMLKNRRCGISGFGRVGQATAKLLRAFGAEVKACDISPNHEAANKISVAFVEKNELLKWSDTLFLSLPLKQDTKNYIAEKELDLLGSESVLINTSRGGVVCENSLYKYLVQHPSFFSAADVFVEEPYNGPLATRDNFIGTCHMGASTRESRKKMEMSAAKSVASFIAAKKHNRGINT